MLWKTVTFSFELHYARIWVALRAVLSCTNLRFSIALV